MTAGVPATAKSSYARGNCRSPADVAGNFAAGGSGFNFVESDEFVAAALDEDP
jgi:hypothetical protein